MSPFLARMDREIKCSTNDRYRAELEARVAGYLARIGEFGRARSIVDRLRIGFGDGHSGRVTISIMIAEALIHHFERLDATALDRITRAQLLSRLIDAADLEAVSSAWRAHIEFDASKFADMFSSLKIAISKATTQNHDARSRIFNVLCKAANLCGDQSRAKIFFHHGRESALKEGDQASIEALQHNRASFRLAWSRAARCLGELSQTELTQTGVEISTAKSLQNIAGIRALSSYINLCDARFAVLDRRFEAALTLFSSIGASDPFPAGSFTRQSIELEMTYCMASLGKINDALLSYHPTEFNDMSSIDLDEQIVVRWIQCQLVKMDERFGDLNQFEILLNEATEGYRKFVNDLKMNLNAISVS